MRSPLPTSPPTLQPVALDSSEHPCENYCVEWTTLLPERLATVERDESLNGPHFHQVIGIDMRHDPQVESHAHLLELGLATHGAPIGQQLLLLVLRIDQEVERFGRAADRDAKIVEEPLRLRRI